MGFLLIRYGSQEFFDQLRVLLNGDQRFRELGQGVYDTVELIIVEDLGIGIYQKTVDGEITDMLLVGRKDLREFEEKSEFVYYVNDYDGMVKMSTGDESFVSLIIDDRIRFRGPLRKAMRFQGANERMEEVIKDLTAQTVIPSSIQYRKWASENGYL